MKLSMHSLRIISLVMTLAGLSVFASSAFGQQTPANNGNQLSGANTLSPAQIDKIITSFAAKETQFRRALNQYAFKRDALIQVLGMGGQVAGEYHRVSDFTFDDQGNRFEKINFFPMATFAGVTPEDLEDLGGVNPFALEAAKLSQYDFKYVGKEKIDELDLYVFDVAPKITPDAKKTKERFFIGRIWVDDQDLQIVKSKGKAVPETKTNKFPVVETYREQIDGKYWFPTYVYADDDLIYDSGQDMRIRMRVKYSDYRVGRGKVTITEIGDAPPETIKPETPKLQSQKPDSQVKPLQTPDAQTPVTRSEGLELRKPVEGGILNDKALELPVPKYPDAARRTRESGEVQVQILIDETGKVVSAHATFGSVLLQGEAVRAARQARFAPRLVDGVPVMVTGILIYKFVAP
jgi:TonB family protein